MEKIMKKFAAVMLTIMMTASLAACAGNKETAETSAQTAGAESSAEAAVSEASQGETKTESAAETGNTDQAAGSESAGEADANTAGAAVDADEEGESKVLVAYFSVTNRTKGIAEYLADGLNADLYEVTPEDPYTEADINYNDSNSRTSIEMNDESARPTINGTVDNMDQYDVVFLGYPIWWGKAPKIMRTFVESYDFSGKTVIPFCTSASSGIGSSASDLEALTSGAAWLEGHRFSGSDSEATVMDWVKGLNY